MKTNNKNAENKDSRAIREIYSNQLYGPQRIVYKLFKVSMSKHKNNV